MGLTSSSAAEFQSSLKESNIPTSEHYYGLENYGNTCYCNSVVQALYHCLPFRHAILTYYQHQQQQPPPLSNDHPNHSTLLVALARLFYKISVQQKQTGYVAPKHFIQNLKHENEMFRGMMHQDAHEFFNFLLNTLSDQLQREQTAFQRHHANSVSQEAYSPWVHDLFQGVLTSETTCLCCETKTNRDETYIDLSLDIEQNISLSACLRKFSSNETLTGRNKFYCQSCLCLQEAQKKIKLKRLPPILILHLKRFKYVEALHRYSKLSYRVVFPFELKAPNCSGDAINPHELYNLFAVVIHIGTGPSHGHYVTVVKSQGKWFLFDDEDVSLIDEDAVRQCFGRIGDEYDGEVEAETGYMLFYQSESTANSSTKIIKQPKMEEKVARIIKSVPSISDETAAQAVLESIRSTKQSTPEATSTTKQINKRYLLNTIFNVDNHNRRQQEDTCWRIHEYQKKRKRSTASKSCDDDSGSESTARAKLSDQELRDYHRMRKARKRVAIEEEFGKDRLASASVDQAPSFESRSKKKPKKKKSKSKTKKKHKKKLKS